MDCCCKYDYDTGVQLGIDEVDYVICQAYKEGIISAEVYEELSDRIDSLYDKIWN